MSHNMLQNTLNSWQFFLNEATGDCISLLNQCLGINEYNPQAVLVHLFQRSYNGVELSYEGYLFDICQKRTGVPEALPIEEMEDRVLIDIIYTAIKRCTEDERDLLIDLLGLGDNTDKQSFKKVLLNRAPAMDKFLLPGIILSLCGPYYKQLDFMTWPFRLDRQHYQALERIRHHVGITYSDWEPTVFIAFHRCHVFKHDSDQECSANEEDIYAIPEDLFSSIVKSKRPFIEKPLLEEFRSDPVRFKTLITRMIEWSGHPTRSNVETLLRVMTGYPFESDQEKLLWDGRQIRVLLYCVKFMYDNKRAASGRGKFQVILDNTEWNPDVKQGDRTLTDANEVSHLIGDGTKKSIPHEVLRTLYGLYPTRFTNPDKHMSNK